jgi:hypothetical protein
MLGMLCVADFGHAMSLLHCGWQKGWQISARAKKMSRLFAASTYKPDTAENE